jgi:hypothetical protein
MRFCRISGKWLAWLLFMAWPAHAAEFLVIEDECNGKQLLIQGPIESGDHQRFVGAMAALVAGGRLPEVQDPQRLWTVRIDSAGGDLEEAMHMGRLLRQAFAITDVGYRFARRPDGVYDFARSEETVCVGGGGRLSGCEPDIVEAECLGACLLVWLGGAERFALEGRLGVRGLADAGDAVHDYLDDMGISRDLAGELLVEPGGGGWLTWSQTRALSVPAAALTSLLEGCPAHLTSEESYLSIAAGSAAERNRLMDQADAHRTCRIDRVTLARARVITYLQRERDPLASGPAR